MGILWFLFALFLGFVRVEISLGHGLRFGLEWNFGGECDGFEGGVGRSVKGKLDHNAASFSIFGVRESIGYALISHHAA